MQGEILLCVCKTSAQRSRSPYDAIVRNLAPQNICGQDVTLVFLLPETLRILWCDPTIRAGLIRLTRAKLFPGWAGKAELLVQHTFCEQSSFDILLAQNIWSASHSCFFLWVSSVSPVGSLQGITSALWVLSEGNPCALTKFENCANCQKLNRSLFKTLCCRSNCCEVWWRCFKTELDINL